jgi:glycerol dehydrogenase-like iron-containing ADH family enzyme
MDVWPLPRLSFRAVSSIDETRLVALITQPSAWASVNGSLKLPLVIQAEPTRDDYDFVEYLAKNLPDPVQVVYAIGDGLVIDVAKVVASANDKPLVIIPTAISSDAVFTPTAIVHEADGISIEPTGPAEEVIFDFDLIRQASADQRTAGIVDVMSIVTGLLDWATAAQKGKLDTDTKLQQWAVALAAGLGATAIKSAVAIGKADNDGLRLLVDLLSMTIQLDNQLGHERASHGIEHMFAESVDADASVSHAEKVAAGILIATALYNKDAAGTRAALEAAGVKLDKLTPDNIRKAVMGLPDYAKNNQLPYSMLHDLSADAPELEQALHKSTLIPGNG